MNPREVGNAARHGLSGRQRISATALAQFVRFGNCERLLYFTLHPEKARELEQRWHISQQPLTPLLHAAGEEFEAGIVARVRASGERVIDLTDTQREAPLAALRSAASGQRLVLAQAHLDGIIGKWSCGGNADLIWLLPQQQPGAQANMPLRALVVDVKSSLNERVEHRLQVAFYVRLLRQMAEEVGVTLATVEGAIFHREEGDTLPTIELDALTRFELAPYDLVLNHLLDGPDAVVSRIESGTFNDAAFSLSFKCEGCLFNGHCMHDSAGREHVALVPYLTASEQRVLDQHGIDTFRALASLTMPAAPGQYRGPLDPAPGKEHLVGALRSYWHLAGLDRHTQRARALVRQRDRLEGAGGIDGAGEMPENAVRTYEPVIDGGFGTLPAEDVHPGLVKIFFDAQHDYLRDGVYLVCALIKGPNGEQVVLERSAAPVDRDAEGNLLERWVPRVYAAVVAQAGAPSAFVHLYTYSRHDQSVLLAALRRHVGRVPAIGALFDLLTESAALAPVSPLAQPMISFLAEEVRDGKTLDVTCTSLHEVATRIGFTWTGQTPSGMVVDFRTRFRARVFDSRRSVEVPVLDGSGATRHTWIEGAARFRSQIPLEYAYGAWGALPKDATGLQARLLEPFLDITWDELEGFAIHRLRAQAHIEADFRLKNRHGGKQPLPLRELAAAVLTQPTLPRALQDFLLIEHHARVQELLLSYAQPIERRVQTGRGMLVECLSYKKLDARNARAVCRVVFDEAGVDAVLAEQALRLKERDWVVVNPPNMTNPEAMLHGRLATIDALEKDANGRLIVRLGLKGLSHSQRVFTYWHRSQDGMVPRSRYAIDEMPDDLNGDKLLAACRAAGNAQLAPNQLLTWLERAEQLGVAAPRHDPFSVPRGAAQSAELARHAAACLKTLTAVEQAASAEGPTAAQAQAIAHYLNESVLLVQGPPGSGKSHTLGWAVLVRLAAARMAGARSFRVAVSSKTHNAIRIVLESIAAKLALLQQYAPYSPFSQAVRDVAIYKLGGEEAEEQSRTGSVAIRQFALYEQRGQIESLLATPWLVAGATPAGLYNAQRYRASGGNDVPWDERPFDLLVLDEASQVNVPEALLACAFVRSDGQALIVGDHRQMPPIVAAEWNEESRRTVVDSEVYRSIFDFLRARRFPYVGLDRSFRLHKQLAAFLEEIIYRQDGIPFYSTREDTLDPVHTGDPYVDTVLDPAYPVIVVEHADTTSQQFNQVELDLIRPILRACVQDLHLDSATGVGVVVPHRAQRARLRAEFPELAAANAIDTVERFQGGEREVIIVSATASDPDYILHEADFLLNPNRLNVALSRPRRKLIVLVSSTLLRLLTSDPDLFEQAALWKRLRYNFACVPLWAGSRAETRVQVFGCPADGSASPSSRLPELVTSPE